MQKDPDPKHPGSPGQMRRPNLRIIAIEESEDFQLKGMGTKNVVYLHYEILLSY